MDQKNCSLGCLKFSTPRLTIREFNQRDLDALLTYESQPGMLQFEQGITNRGSAQRFLRKAIRCANVVPRTNYYLGITLTPDDEVIGRISLTSQNLTIREWEIGWAVRIEDWGKGFTSEAAQRMLAFAFENLNAHRVVAFCHAENAASARVMEKIGMKQEGRLRQTRWFNKQWADEYVYAILEVDFPKNDRQHDFACY